MDSVSGAAVSGQDHDREAVTGNIRQVNRERILQAATTVFADAGFGGATMLGIANAAGLPKANLHYYFGTKQALYAAVLDNILTVWLDAADAIVPERDPAVALADYIRAKIEHSRRFPQASKVFASEMMRGAPLLKDFLAHRLRDRVDAKVAVIEGWARQGRIVVPNPRHLLFQIWAMTQTYADFAVQIAAVLGVETLGPAEFAAAGDTAVTLILRGCGLTPPGVPVPAPGSRQRVETATQN